VRFVVVIDGVQRHICESPEGVTTIMALHPGQTYTVSKIDTRASTGVDYEHATNAYMPGPSELEWCLPGGHFGAFAGTSGGEPPSTQRVNRADVRAPNHGTGPGVPTHRALQVVRAPDYPPD
jgi:hypothetical protein